MRQTYSYPILKKNDYPLNMTQSRKLTDAQIASILKRLTQAGLFESPSAEGLQLSKRNLDFTKGWSLLHIENQRVTPLQHHRFFWHDTKDVKQARYSPDPYKDNDFADLELNVTEEWAFAYLQLYLMFFMKDGQRLTPVISAEDISFLDDLIPPARKTLEKFLSLYPTITARNEDHYDVTAACLFDRSLLEIDFTVHSQGLVNITNRKTLIEDLPVHV